MSEEQPADMLVRLGSVGFLWAQEFNKTAVRLGYSEMDEGWLIGWFANAIEHSCNPLRNECERLREENARLIRENKVAFEAVGGVVKANDKLKEENARLREALKPFAEAFESDYAEQEEDHWDLWESAAASILTYGHLRAAAVAMGKEHTSD